MFIVAYPNANVSTEFEFKYWVGSYDKTVWDLAIDFDFKGVMGYDAKILVLSLSAALLCYTLTCCGCCIKNCNEDAAKDKVIILTEEPKRSFAKRSNYDNTSGLELID